MRNLFKISSVLLSLWIVSPLYAQAVLYPAHGKAIPFDQLKGKWVLINYWASWCEPCLAEIPELNQLYQQRHQYHLALFAVNYDMQPANVQRRLSRAHHIHYPILIKDPAEALQLGDIRGVPVTFIFNPEGKLVETFYGGLKAKRVIRYLYRLSSRPT